MSSRAWRALQPIPAFCGSQPTNCRSASDCLRFRTASVGRSRKWTSSHWQAPTSAYKRKYEPCRDWARRLVHFPQSRGGEPASSSPTAMTTLLCSPARKVGALSPSAVGELTHHGGDAVLVSNSDMLSTRMVRRSHHVTLSLPRKVMLTMVPDLEDAFVRPVPNRFEPLRLL